MVGQERLSTKVTSIINRIEQDLDSVDLKIGEAMHVLDLDNDGLVRPRCSFSHFMNFFLCTMPVWGCQVSSEGVHHD